MLENTLRTIDVVAKAMTFAHLQSLHALQIRWPELSLSRVLGFGFNFVNRGLFWNQVGFVEILRLGRRDPFLMDRWPLPSRD